jgi:hypothetical protein
LEIDRARAFLMPTPNLSRSSVSFGALILNQIRQTELLSIREHRPAEMLPCEDKMKSRETDPGLLQENQIILGYD